MTPLQLPPAVPGHGWPILSAVRYGTSDQPAEYIVVVDCGEGTPTVRYATMHVFVFPNRIKFRDGEYDLTFTEAQRSMAERAHLAPRHQVDVVVLAHEPHSRDVTAVFVDGHAVDGVAGPVTVTACVLYLDPDDEDDDLVQAALHQADSLSAAAARYATDAVTHFTAATART